MANDTATIDMIALHENEEREGGPDEAALRKIWGKLNGGRWIEDPVARTFYLLRVVAGWSEGHPLEYTESQVERVCDDQLAMQAVEVAERAAALADGMGACDGKGGSRASALGPDSRRARYARMDAEMKARFGATAKTGEVAIVITSDLTPAGLAAVKQRARDAGVAGLDVLAIADLLELAWEERDAARAPVQDSRGLVARIERDLETLATLASDGRVPRYERDRIGILRHGARLVADSIEKEASFRAAGVNGSSRAQRPRSPRRGRRR